MKKFVYGFVFGVWFAKSRTVQVFFDMALADWEKYVMEHPDRFPRSAKDIQDKIDRVNRKYSSADMN